MYVVRTTYIMKSKLFIQLNKRDMNENIYVCGNETYSDFIIISYSISSSSSVQSYHNFFFTRHNLLMRKYIFGKGYNSDCHGDIYSYFYRLNLFSDD